MKFVLNIFWWRISSYIYAENFSPLTLLYFLEVIFTVLCGILAVIHQRWIKICWKLEPCKSWRVEVICRPLWFNLPSQRSGQLRSGMPPNNTLQGVTMKSTITTQQWPKEQYHCTEWSVTLDIICSSCHIWWDNVTSWHNVTRLQCYKLAQCYKITMLQAGTRSQDTCSGAVKAFILYCQSIGYMYFNCQAFILYCQSRERSNPWLSAPDCHLQNCFCLRPKSNSQDSRHIAQTVL